MKKLKFLSLTLFLMLAVTVLMGSGCLNQEETQESTIDEQAEEEAVAEEMVTVVINYGDEEKNYEVVFEEGMTAYDALKEAAGEDSLEIKTTEYDFGMSIDAIGDKEGGQDNMYWMYYIDGAAAPVAVDKQEVTAGTKIEFKYEKSEF